MDEPLLTRNEISHTLLANLDLNRDVERIRVLLEEEDDGEDGESDT